MNVYHGGRTPVDRTIHLYIDNLVIATSYIGPMSAAVSTRVPLVRESLSPPDRDDPPIER